MFLDRFDVLISKLNLKNKKNYFNTFLNKKYFKLLQLIQSAFPLRWIKAHTTVLKTHQDE
jgi:hypothetical protein